MQPAQSEEQRAAQRARIKLLGMIFWAAGAAMCAVGAISIISSYFHLVSEMDSIGGNATGETPKFAWCIYAGLPPLAIGTAIRFYVKTRRW